jgi:hypothetical protein
VSAEPLAVPASPATPLPRSLAAPVAVLGAVLVLAGDVYHLFVLDDRPTQAGSALYTGHGIAIMLGLLLLVLAALSVASRGRLAHVALSTMVIGTALVVGDIWAEVVVLPGVMQATAPELLGEDIGGQHLAMVIAAFALFAVGWVLFALSMRAVAGPISWLLVVGGVIAFLPVGGSYVVLAIGAALVVARATHAGETR